MKFQNPGTLFKTYALHKKVCNVQMPKVTKGHNSRSIFQNLFKSSSDQNEESIYEISKNPSMHSSKFMLCIKKCAM